MNGRKASLVLNVTLAVLATALPAAADIQRYPLTFTGADVLNNVFVAGSDGSTPADNDLYHGARMLRVGTSSTHPDVGLTYRAARHDNFIARWNDLSAAGYKLHWFQFWGLDGAAVPIWGEDYKPYDWSGGGGPENWQIAIGEFDENWSPGGHHTLKYPYWSADPEYGLPMGEFVEVNGQWQYNPDPSLEDYVFTVDLFLDTSDAWWGGIRRGRAQETLPIRSTTLSLLSGLRAMWARRMIRGHIFTMATWSFRSRVALSFCFSALAYSVRAAARAACAGRRYDEALRSRREEERGPGVSFLVGGWWRLAVERDHALPCPFYRRRSGLPYPEPLACADDPVRVPVGLSAAA